MLAKWRTQPLIGKPLESEERRLPLSLLGMSHLEAAFSTALLEEAGCFSILLAVLY
jgi:hypothetical protein